MRRKEKEITELQEIETIIRQAEVCYLGLAVENQPYVVPLNYGYRDRILYIHCAPEGRKLDIIRQNNRVSFTMSVDNKIEDKGDLACQWGCGYRSVIGFGHAQIISTLTEKKEALDIIMEHYSGRTSFDYKPALLEQMVIIQITIESMGGKKSG